MIFDILLVACGVSSLLIIGLAHGILADQGKNTFLAFSPFGFYIYVKHTYEETGKIGIWFLLFLLSILGLIGLGFAWLLMSM